MENAKDKDMAFGGSCEDGVYGGNGIDRSQYLSTAPAFDEDEEFDQKNTIYTESWRQSSRIEGRRELMDTGDEDDVNLKAYREQNGSGIVNTRISDRESEVSVSLELTSIYSSANSHQIIHSYSFSTRLGRVKLIG